MPRSLVLACVALVLCACSPEGFSATKKVNAEEFGSGWPLTVDTARVYNDCGDGSSGVGLIVKGREFNLDDLASRDDAPDAFVPYWMEDASQPSGLKDLSPLLDEGRAICD